MNPNLILNELNQFTGTGTYYRTLNPDIVFTDGVKYLAEKCHCFWLIDVIVSYQPNPEEFQVWELKKEGSTCTIKMQDGNKNYKIKQFIEYTDFPLNAIVIWFTNNVIYLPSEH